MLSRWDSWERICRIRAADGGVVALSIQILAAKDISRAMDERICCVTSYRYGLCDQFR